ncbi:MAG TPA: peroxiredoxin [Vicinamibacterales bacterium]|nr:peroxiredoxin [Vicinamibacterales bacterium]
MLNVGSVAPDFTLPSHTGLPVRLSDFRGRQHVVLAFHPLAFTPVCAVQMKTYERERPTLDALNAHVLAVSVDAGPSKKAWADSLGGITYDLLSDFHPHGKVASDYGVMRNDGISERAVFLIDKAGKIVWAKLYQIPEQPDFDEVVRQLKQIGH